MIKNELFNDNGEFISNAGSIINEIYPVNTSNIKVTIGKLPKFSENINQLTLSSKMNQIRCKLNHAFQIIRASYDYITKEIYINMSINYNSTIEYANSLLNIVRNNLYD